MSLGPTVDVFTVSGRGGLHLGILIETMRREGYEFAVGPMTVELLLPYPLPMCATEGDQERD